MKIDENKTSRRLFEVQPKERNINKFKAKLIKQKDRKSVV